MKRKKFTKPKNANEIFNKKVCSLIIAVTFILGSFLPVSALNDEREPNYKHSTTNNDMSIYQFLENVLVYDDEGGKNQKITSKNCNKLKNNPDDRENKNYASISSESVSEKDKPKNIKNNQPKGNNVFIVDKRHDEILTHPCTTFYVERTIDGPIGSNAIFVSMFSESLNLEFIEIFEKTATNSEANILQCRNKIYQIFEFNKPITQKEQEIKQLIEKLPIETEVLNQIAYTIPIELRGPRKIRLTFNVPSLENIKSELKPTSGEISYLVYSENQINNFDFEGSTWWNSDWKYRKSITINSNKITKNLTNFPLLIKTTDSDLASNAQSDGEDIIFTDFNGVKLNHEIETYHSVDGNLTAWINVTNLSSTEDTILYMYYGNETCNSQQNVEGVWDSHFLAVACFIGLVNIKDCMFS
jgi:hypothetical protein